MSNLRKACDYLGQAIAEYNAARSIPAVETAILAMHTGLETAFRAYLEQEDRLSSDTQEALQKPGGVSFPDLVDLAGDHTNVLGADRRIRALLVSLNTTRVRIAHPLNRPPQEQIVNDAQRLAELIIALWPGLFADKQAPRVTPVTMRMVREGLAQPSPQPTPSPPQPSTAAEIKEKRRPAQPRSALLQSLWRGETKPHRWFRRLLGGLVVAGLAILAWRSAVILARWPSAVKTASVVLVIVALGLATWGGWLLWRVFRLLGVRRLLIVLSVLYLSVVSVAVVTGADERPLAQTILLQMQGVAGQAWGTLAGFTRSLVEAPATFRFAYTGGRPLVDVPGVQVDPTLIEGEIIEPLVYTTLDELTPTARPAPRHTPVPPEPEVSGEIQIGGYVQVSGTGGQRLRARSGPGKSNEVVTRFDEGIQVLVLEGPVEADGYAWWAVRGDQGEGWCAGRWLVPVR